MSTLKISDKLKEIYKSEGIPEPELMKIETHEIEEEYIETNDGLFCCTGCIGKYKEKKEKREAFRSIETPRDTIRRLQKEIAEYWKEIEDLKSKNQCFSDSSKILQRALEEERTRYDKLREELKDIKYKLDVEKTENYEIQKENEGLKAENEKLKEEIKRISGLIKTVAEDNIQFQKYETQIKALKEENEKLKKENKDLINERNYYETYSIEFEQRIEQLKRENKMLETLSCNRSDEIVSLKREIHNEKIKSEAYKSNAEVILPDAEKIKNEARAELAEVKLKMTDLEKIVKDLEKFIDGALKLEVPGSPVYCLLKGMKEVLSLK